MTSQISLIFDLDGTLFDTAPGLMQTMNVLLARRGRGPVAFEEVRPQVSHGARAIMDFAMSRTGKGVGDDEVEELFKEFITHYASIMSKASTPYPGLVNALQALRDKGHLMAVCTNRYEKSATDLVSALQLGHHFSAIVGQDTIGIAKPDPAPVFETLKRMGGTAARAIFIGDSEVDVAAAKAANLPVIAVSFGYAGRPANELGADAVIDHFDELDDVIRTLISSRG